MPPTYIRDFSFYEDADGYSEVQEQLRQIRREDDRGFRTIQNKIRLVCQQTFDDALRSGLIKKPTPTVYVLKVQSGAVAYRLPFFEPLCRNGALIVFTQCERRAGLRGDNYDALVGKAAARRLDWLTRNCKDGIDAR